MGMALHCGLTRHIDQVGVPWGSIGGPVGHTAYSRSDPWLVGCLLWETYVHDDASGSAGYSLFDNGWPNTLMAFSCVKIYMACS